MRHKTSPPELYDMLVPGSGEAGKYLAWTLAKQSRKVVVRFTHPTLPEGLITLFSAVPATASK